MKPLKDPPRLFESGEAPSELRNLLQLAHDDVPSVVTVDELSRFVEAQATSSSPLQPSVECGPTPRTSRSKLGRFVLKGLFPLAAIGIGVGVWRVTGQPQVPAKTDVLTAENTKDISVSTTTVVAVVPKAESSQVPIVSSESTRVNARTPAVRARSALQNTVSTLPPQSETDEYTLLAAARREKSRNPALSLKLADEHARLFPSGMLSQEREAIAIESLLALGRSEQAKSRTQRFARRFPNSPHLARIEAAVQRSSAAGSRP
jgi:hypothetical protein